ncbi:hypothetical protein BCR43DRAFT_520263 [Syncephalastrum racemosum]|uniref:SWIM-type domain-containing protein n=1 Tax=Syncephalastrum racemosum TaxID=13706 RepID=A0A1X2HU04_SYNRA|nr:hypothetical protein BCR43DRAFT_520263 [Syncephalastrum racemosum]
MNSSTMTLRTRTRPKKEPVPPSEQEEKTATTKKTVVRKTVIKKERKPAASRPSGIKRKRNGEDRGTAAGSTSANASSASTSTSARQPRKKKTKSAVVDLTVDDEADIKPGLQDRYRRAKSQKMYVLGREDLGETQKFVVLGSTGNAYTCSIGPTMMCDCYDFRYRRSHCKHLLMILIKVYHASVRSRAFESLRLSQTTRAQLFSQCTVSPEIMVNEKVYQAIQKKMRGEASEPEEVQNSVDPKRKPLDDSDCPICYEEFDITKPQEAIYCTTCYNNVHKKCFDVWKNSGRSVVTCVWCRAAWPDVKKDKAKSRAKQPGRNSAGFLNFADEVGLTSRRSTSGN